MDDEPCGTIRPMHLDDAEAVAALIRRAFGAIGETLDPPPSALRETAAGVRDQLRAGGGAVWQEGGRGPVLGGVLWREQEGGLYLCRLAVEPARQGAGIARRLIAAVEAASRQAGLARIHLGVRLALPGNRRLFAAAGFRETGVETHEGYTAPTWVRAEKWLA